MAAAQTSHAHARSLYRRILRELPSRSPSALANTSPLQQQIRADFSMDGASTEKPPSLQHQSQKAPARRLEEAEQYVQYLKAQRTYTTLLERYNPGMNMDAEERVRLTARRVGMEMPVEFMKKGGGIK